jgi:hypothetical protein
MSYNIDGQKKQDNRVKINNVIIPSGSSRDFPRCIVCIDQPRLQVSNSPEGKRIGVCVKSCGQTFELEKTTNQETGGSMLTPKYTSKYGSAGKQHSFIVSQNKKKKPGEINSDAKSDIRKAFGATDGITLIDEREGGTY